MTSRWRPPSSTPALEPVACDRAHEGFHVEWRKPVLAEIYDGLE